MTGRPVSEMQTRGQYVGSRYNYSIVAPPLIARETEVDEAAGISDSVVETADRGTR